MVADSCRIGWFSKDTLQISWFPISISHRLDIDDIVAFPLCQVSSNKITPFGRDSHFGACPADFFRSDHFLDLFSTDWRLGSFFAWCISGKMTLMVFLSLEDDALLLLNGQWMSMVQENTAGELQDRASKTQETAQMLWNCCPSCSRPLQMQDNRNFTRL